MTIPVAFGLAAPGGIRRDELEEGPSCGLHRVARLMRQGAMRARPKRRGGPKGGGAKECGARSVTADDIPDRRFVAKRPTRKWPADFTCVRTAEGRLHVAVVPDPFSPSRGRRVDDGGPRRRPRGWTP